MVDPRRAIAALKKLQDVEMGRLSTQVEDLSKRVAKIEEDRRVEAAIEHHKEATGKHQLPASLPPPKPDSPADLLKLIAPWLMGLIGLATILAQVVLKLVG